MLTKLKTIKQVLGLYTFILIIWGFYRFLFRLPENIEELILKPLIWLGPTLWLIRREKANLTSIGWSGKNLFKSLYLGIGLGIIFAVEGALTNSLKYGGSSFVGLPYLSLGSLIFALVVSLVTAISEETVFRGFIFSRLCVFFKNEWKANLWSSLGWVLVHLPVTIFILHYTPVQTVTYFILVFIFGVGSALVYARTKTVVASVLLHVFWSWPILLFR